MAKNYSPEEAAKVVRAIFNRVLERDPDDAGMIKFGSQLDRGERTIREIIRNIGKSEEYGKKFVTDVGLEEAVKQMYKHFLAREAESDDVVRSQAANLVNRGWQHMVESFVNSDEFSKRFGDDRVPA